MATSLTRSPTRSPPPRNDLITPAELDRLEVLTRDAVFLWRAYVRDKCPREDRDSEEAALEEFKSLMGVVLKGLRGKELKTPGVNP